MFRIPLQAQNLDGLEDALREIVTQAVAGPGGLREVADAVGGEAIRQLQGHTAEMRPPIKRGGPLRAAHLGHWADRTKVLVRAYRHVVEASVWEVALDLINDDPGGYGKILEDRGFFFVLKGVADAGGPVDVVMREVIASRYPHWEVDGG